MGADDPAAAHRRSPHSTGHDECTHHDTPLTHTTTAGARTGRAFLRDAIDVSAFSKRVQRIRRQATTCSPFRERRPHVGRERILQAPLGRDEIGGPLRGSQPLVVDDRGLGIEPLRHVDGLDHRLDLAFEVVALIDDEGDVRARARLPFEEQDLVKDAKHLIRIDGPERQVVVRIAAIVEVEPSEHAFVEQPRDDLLDVLRRVVVTGIHQHLRLRARTSRQQQRHAPIGDVGVVEGGLERLVFDEQPPIRIEHRVHVRESLGKETLPRADVRRSRIVGAVGEPERHIARAERTRDLDALDAVIEGAPTDASRPDCRESRTYSPDPETGSG